MTRFQAIASCTCPQCRTGKMFPFATYNLQQFSVMHTKCPVCSITFEIEPGFFWGAMYFSYVLMVAESALAGLFTFLVVGSEAHPLVYVSALVVVVIACIPLNFRLSRSLMLHLFGEITYKPR